MPELILLFFSIMVQYQFTENIEGIERLIKVRNANKKTKIQICNIDLFSFENIRKFFHNNLLYANNR